MSAAPGGISRTYNDRASCPSVPLVDRVTVLVEQIRAVHVSAGFHGPFPLILRLPAPEDNLPLVVDRLQFKPHVKSVDRAAREEVPTVRVLATTSTRTESPRRTTAEVSVNWRDDLRRWGAEGAQLRHRRTHDSSPDRK